VAGVGLHTGVSTTLTFQPASPGHGIKFQRSDLPFLAPISATTSQVSSTDRRTSLGPASEGVHTVEHVLAALVAHQVDDVLVELNGPEPPALDGSAGPFFAAITQAGVRETSGQPDRIRPAKTIELQHGDSSYQARPSDRLRVSVTIEWAHPLIGRQTGCYEVTPENFARELAGARTFGFAHEVTRLRDQGLIRGADTSSALVLTEQDVLDNQLRWPDEFVRHKSVDLVGDLGLLGGRLEMDVVAHRPSHAGNVALARTLHANLQTGTPMAMGIEEILKILPHRYPMLLVDRILEVHGTERIVGIKNVTFNEPFFQGHFPGHPVMPGVLIVEAMAQVGGVLVMSGMKLPENAVVYFLSIDGVKFRRPVVPGDQLRFEVETVQVRGKTVKMKGRGLVDGKVVAEAEFMAQVVDR
jgi:UDP-3-O-[3-hydroxymyristoyl] N-acetylglucosamine deacetylase/3-hydroxyacyl-[acyl-carrier-protein] dehydratase